MMRAISEPDIAASFSHHDGPRLAAQPLGWAPRLPILAAVGLYILVWGSLFTGLPGPSALGELRGEGALIGAGFIMLFAVISGVIRDVRGMRAILIFLPLAACVLLSYAVNAGDIGRAHFLGRAGSEKFISSLMVLGFYATAFYAMFCVVTVYGVDLVLLYTGRAAMAASAVLCLAMAFEIVTWFSPPLREAWSTARALWLGGPGGAPLFRLVGFAPEPSFNSITSLGLLGLLGAQAVLCGRSGGRPGAHWRMLLILSIALFSLQLAANARTFLAGAAGAGLAWLLVGPVGKALPPMLKSAAIIFAPLAVQAAMIWSVLESAPGTRSVSNITRSIGMFTATELWTAHPLLGVGLGQYGFHFRSAVPSWGLQSWEISRYFLSDQYELLGGLPPSFSLFTRLGSELGLLGFLAWSLPPLYALRRALILSPGPLTSVMACALAAQIWTGLSLDSFRNIFYWFWLACLLAWPSQSAAQRPRTLNADAQRAAQAYDG